MAVYKRVGLAAKDVALSSVALTGMMLRFCRHSCQILPATLQGRRTGVSDISVRISVPPYFAKVHGYCFKTVRYSDSPLTVSARNIGRL